MINESDRDRLEPNLSNEQKFYKIEQLARKRQEEEHYQDYNGEWVPRYSDYDYVIAVLAVADAFGIDELSKYSLPDLDDANNARECRHIKGQAMRLSSSYMFAEDKMRKSVALDAATKEKISRLLQKARDLVQKADIAVEKKDKLFALIDDLQKEVNRERTPLHAIGAAIVTVCGYADQGAKQLDGVVALFERVCAALGIAKEKEEAAVKLAPRIEPKRIEGPKRKPEHKSDIDDEIPF